MIYSAGGGGREGTHKNWNGNGLVEGASLRLVRVGEGCLGLCPTRRFNPPSREGGSNVKLYALI